MNFLKRLIQFGPLPVVVMLACLGSNDSLATPTNTLIVSPLAMSFTGTPGLILPKSLSISTTNGSVPLTITATSGLGWLAVSPTMITATSTIETVAVEINNVLLPGGQTYEGTITISGTGVSTVVVNVSLTVSPGQSQGGFTSSPLSLSLSSTVGGTQQSAPLTINTTASTTAVTVQATTADGIGWLGVSPQSGSVVPGPGLALTVFATPGTLAANTYTGSINVFTNGQTTASLTVPVTFTVTPQSTGLLAVNPAPLSFNFANSSSSPQNQTVTISTTSNLVEQITITPSPTSGWLTVAGSTGVSNVTLSRNLPAQVVVSVDPSTLGVNTFHGQVTFSNADLGSVVEPVKVVVGSGASAPLAATPSPINVTIPSGNASIVNQALTVTLSPGNFTSVEFAATVSQPSGQSWLSVNPASVQTVASGGHVTLTVTVNPAGLSPGNYDTSTVILTPTGGGAPLTIPVNLAVGGLPTLTVDPTTLNFAYQTLTAAPPAQTLNVTSTGPSLGFSVTPSSSGGNWLVVTPLSGSTSPTPGAAEPLTVAVNPTGLQANTYQGTVQVSSTGASNSPQTANVILLVTNQPVLTPTPSSVTFNYQYQSAVLPLQQNVSLSSSGNAIPFNASFITNSGGAFATVTPSTGTTPQTVSIALNPAIVATLAPNVYQGTVEILSSTAGNAPLNLNVTLVVSNNTTLVPSQTSMAFNYQVGQAGPVHQTLVLTSSGTPLSYSAEATSTNCGNFLTIANALGTTPGSIAVSMNTSQAHVGTCTGAITVTAADAGNSPLTIPVTLQVSSTPLINLSPAYLNLTTQLGSNPAAQTIALTSTDPNTPIAFNITSATNGGNWLLVGPTSGSTPQNLTLGFQTSSLAAGTYSGTVTVSPTVSGANPITVPIQVVVTSSVTSSATPTSLTFNQTMGGTAPQPQTLQITSSTPGLTYSASASVAAPTGGNWLTVTTGSGTTTPGTITVSANGATLGQGTYPGTITVLMPGASPSVLLIPVNLVIGPPPTLAVSTNTLSFTAIAGTSTLPATQSVMVTSTGPPVTFTVLTSSNLFAVSPTTGTTPHTLTVGLNAQALAALAPSTTPYTGTITVGSSEGAQTINVSVTVQATPPPAVTSVVNSASSIAGPISPGEIISIFGTNIGPSTPVGLTLTSGGTVATSLGNTTVTINGVAAPLIYVSNHQINAIAPYEVADLATANVEINFNAMPSAAFSVNIGATSPAIFTTSQGGTGQGAILNHNASVNSTSNPAAKGSVISIYATGEGLTSPAQPTGSVTPSTGTSFPTPIATPIAVTIGGLSAEIRYVGEAPGLVAGALQVNAVIPANVASGPAVPVVLTVGNASSPPGVTVAIQ